MKTLIIDAIVGAGFPTVTLAITAEQGGLAVYRAGYLEGTHVWLRDKLEDLSLKNLKMIYEGLRSERENLANQVPEPAPKLAPVIQLVPGVH